MHRDRLSNWLVRRIWKNNSLSIVLFGLFFVVMAGQSVTGWQTYNDERSDHGQPTIGYDGYLTSGHFGEAIFENWESEFLQMAFFILLTVYFRQRGSAESKKVEGSEDVDKDPHRLRGAAAGDLQHPSLCEERVDTAFEARRVAVPQGRARFVIHFELPALMTLYQFPRAAPTLHR